MHQLSTIVNCPKNQERILQVLDNLLQKSTLEFQTLKLYYPRKMSEDLQPYCTHHTFNLFCSFFSKSLRRAYQGVLLYNSNSLKKSVSSSIKDKNNFQLQFLRQHHLAAWIELMGKWDRSRKIFPIWLPAMNFKISMVHERTEKK